jgi:hypothetical protein
MEKHNFFWQDCRLVDQLVLKLQRKQRKTKRSNGHPNLHVVFGAPVWQLYCMLLVSNI